MSRTNGKIIFLFALAFTILLCNLTFPSLGQAASLIDIFIEGELEYSTSPVYLKAIGLYSDGSTMDITDIVGGEWRTSNSDIATVYGGKVKFKGETGRVRISFTFNNITDYVETDVTEEDVDEESYVLKFDGELDPDKKSNTLKVYKLYHDGRKVNLKNTDVEWSSSNIFVATVDEKGKVTFTGQPGQVTIKAHDGKRSVSQTVVVPYELVEISINESLNFTSSFFTNPPRLTVTGKNNSGQTQPVPNPVWSSSNENIATINSQGQINFTGQPGKVTFEVKSGNLKDSIDCTVPEPERKNVQKIYITENLFYGKEPQTLTAFALYTDGTKEEITKEAQWTSSNENVASVREGQVYFTGGYGPVEITCNYQGFTDRVQALITKPEKNQLREIKFADHFLTGNDNGKKLIVYGVYTDNSKKPLANVSLSSLHPDIAYIRNNTLYLTKNLGKATLVAQAGKFRDTMEVETISSEERLPLFIKIIGTLDDPGRTKNLKAVAVYSDGVQEDITADAVWNTSDRKIANITNQNKIELTGVGPVKISASYKGLQAYLSNKSYYQFGKIHPLKANLISLENLRQKLETKLKQASFLPTPPDIYGHWAQKDIELARRLGWLGGYPDGTMGPDKIISRGEFVSLVQRALDLKATSQYINYTDINNHWAQSSIRILANLGIIPLKSNSPFRPDDPLTREEMAQMLANLIEVRADNYYNYLDVPPSHKSAAAIANLSQVGIMKGMDDLYFKPTEPATRAQALTAILRLLKTEPLIEGVLTNQGK